MNEDGFLSPDAPGAVGTLLFPGETIVTSLWNEGDRIVIAATAKERGAPVISNSAITLR